MSMTFRELQNAVLADAFAEGRRSSVKTWIKARHAWLWGAEEWTFRFAGPTSVTFTASSQTVNLGSVTDLQSVVDLYDAQGYPLRGYRDSREFFRIYNANALQGSTGAPEAFTVVNGSVIVGPKGDGTTGLLFYEKAPPPLSADSDTTGLPDQYDLALVHGGKAEGFKLTNVNLASQFDQDFTAHVAALKRDYLKAVRGATTQWGAWRP